ncbi:MAG: FGGY-family carbohydrate kinase [Treponema sp.]|jgi:xylulokinase|nr:FGGY-family carbohydrate kinase [Treponema sp.]
MDLLMGIDLGSTSVKAVIYDISGKPVASASCKLDTSNDDPAHPSWRVWKHEDVWASVRTVISRSVKDIPPGGKLRAMAVTGFGMDGLPLDKDGRELFPLISWHCPRTIPQFEQTKKIITDEEMFTETGVRPMVINSIYRIMWMQQNKPDILEKADKWLLIEDYVNYKLSGEKLTDFSMASTFSAMVQQTHTWSEKIISRLNLPGHIFPRPTQSGTVLGKVLPSVCAETGLSGDELVVLGGHDYICAALAASIRSGSDLMDVNGTWEMLVKGMTRVDTAYTDNYYYIESHVARNVWCGISSAISGDMMEWLKDNYGKPGDGNVWESLMAEAEKSSPGSRGCTFLPHFSGSTAPRVEPASLGSYSGMSNDVTRGDIIRATVEGLTYKTREMLEAMCADSAETVKGMKATGGAIKNRFWMQAKADILGLPVEIPELYEATPLGAAMLAGIGAGLYRDEEDAIRAVYRSGAVFEPDMKKHEQYSDYYENIYLKLQGALKEVNLEIFNRFRK